MFNYFTTRTTKDEARAAKAESWTKSREHAIATLNSGEAKSMEATLEMLAVLVNNNKIELLPSELVELTL